jgi:hypothetical protein
MAKLGGWNGQPPNPIIGDTEMKDYKNLSDLTGQESGIVVYGVGSYGVDQNGAEAIICNWSQIQGLPRLDPLGIFPMGLHEIFSAIEQPYLADVGDWLEMANGKLPNNINLIYDVNNDLKTLPGTAGKLFFIHQGGEESSIAVIAPDGWA